MNLKTVTLFFVLSLVSGRREGSGGYNFISDDSDLDYDGSGDDLDTLLLLPDDGEEDDYDIPFNAQSQDYDDDLNDYIYSDDDYDDEDTDLTLTADEDEDSVLRIIEDSITNVEIKPKPEENEFILETSQILIMVGSAFVSFGFAMLSFFLCKRSMEKRKQKARIVNAIKSNDAQSKPSPIVKNYQRVPTDTQEYLKTQDTHIDMYRGDSQAACDPLIK